jgi:hypothetical protein
MVEAMTLFLDFRKKEKGFFHIAHALRRGLYENTDDHNSDAASQTGHISGKKTIPTYFCTIRLLIFIFEL